MKYIPHKVINDCPVPKRTYSSGIFFFDAMKGNLSLEFMIENTTLFFKGKKSSIKKYQNDPKSPYLEGYGFLREDGVEIQIINAKIKNQYLLIANPSDEKNIESIKHDLEGYLASLR